MKSVRWILLLLSLVGFPGPASYGYPPTLLLGVQGGGIWFEPPEDGADALPVAALSRWRLAHSNPSLGAIGSWPVRRGCCPTSACPCSLPTAKDWICKPACRWAGAWWSWGRSGCLGHGDGEDPAHLHPRWQAGLRLGGGDFQGILTYRGSYLYQPDDVEDFLYQGLSLGAEWERSSLRPLGRTGFRLGVLAGLLPAERRGGFHRSSPPGRVGRAADRVGRAGRLLPGLEPGSRHGTALVHRQSFASLDLGLEEGSENCLYAALEAEADWSPHRSVGLQLASFLRQEWYLTRAALTAASADTGETLRVFSLGLTGRAYWTPNNRLFLVLEGSLGRRFANYPAEERWNASMQAGLE